MAKKKAAPKKASPKKAAPKKGARSKWKHDQETREMAAEYLLVALDMDDSEARIAEAVKDPHTAFLGKISTSKLADKRKDRARAALSILTSLSG